MSNPAKVKVSVESQNPTLAFFKDGSANVQSSLVNIGNELKMKKYIQDSSTLEDVMTVNEDGAIRFHKNVTFSGESVIQNVQSVILQDQKLEIGSTNANQVNSSGVEKTAGTSSYSYTVASNTGILTTDNLLIGKNDLTNGPGYTSTSYTNSVARINTGEFSKIGSTTISSAINVVPTDSTSISSLNFFVVNTQFEQNITNMSLANNNLTITYATSSASLKLEDLVVGQLLLFTITSIYHSYYTYANNKSLLGKYGVITNISANTIVVKFTNLNTGNMDNGSQSGSDTILFTPATLTTNITASSIVTSANKYKFTATDSNVDFTLVYSVGNNAHFKGLNYTTGGSTSEVFNESNLVSAVGTTFITVENSNDYTVANFTGSPVFVSKLASLVDNTGISIIGNSSGSYVKGSLAYDNSSNKTLKLENNAGAISIGADSNSYGVNIGTQGNRAISIGNSSSGALSIQSGTGATITTANNSNISFTTTNTADTIVTTGQLLVTAKDNVANAILLTADNGTSQTINIKNQTGTSAGSIQLTSDVGGVQISAADEKDVVMGNSSADVYVKVSASATAANEKISVVNTNGSGDESILLNSAAGGAKFKVANGKNLVLGNSSENLYVKLSPHSTVASEKLSIVNTNGTAADSILLNSVAGGVQIKVANEKDAVFGNTAENAYVKVSASATAASEKVSVFNTYGTAADSISINSVAGGVQIKVANEKDAVFGNTAATAFVKVNASATAASEKVSVVNTNGTAADSISINSVAGGVQIKVANEKVAVFGNTAATAFVKVNASATAASEKVSVVNTNGTAADSISINSVAGGVQIKVANEKDAVFGNTAENAYVKVSASATASSEKVSVVNTYGTAEDAIYLNSISGGAKVLVADSKNLVLGNSGEDIYFKVSPSATVANEKMSVVNTYGTAADSIFINSVAGGLTMTSGGVVNLATNNNTGAVNIGTLGDRTTTIGINSGTSKVIIDAVNVQITNGITVSSDIRLKENFEPMSDALELVSQLNGTYYTWKKDAGTDRPRKLGFIAQEVEKIIPELVKTDSEGMKSVDYVSVVPVLVEAIKNQQKQINELKALLHA